MIFDTEKDGLNTIFRPYQVSLMEYIWEINKETRIGITSGQAHQLLQKTGNEDLMKSRASVVIFLQDMVEEGVLENKVESGRGGYHGVYYPKKTRDEFCQHVVSSIVDKLKTL
ncbi:MAG: hypothetical protein JSV27_11505 [Candidatus Bathyarchaeota archaeon]|nr:MAG: hypothetical protein JSV27_11505 [Candidatus Bathyarchaeota archaeon]